MILASATSLLGYFDRLSHSRIGVYSLSIQGETPRNPIKFLGIHSDTLIQHNYKIV